MPLTFFFVVAFLGRFAATSSSSRFAATAHWQVVIWFSGIRGAIAFALSQQMPLANQDL
jgi:NhaP-type Na+/H+ or K+/H+ antiporter